jgi:hypothetical protein
MAKSFRDRIAGSLDHPVDTACAARPPDMIITIAACAAAGAGLGSGLGGSALWAGAGGGTGAAIAILIVWVQARGTGLSLGMALALADDRLELHRLNFLGTRATGLIRAIPYAEIRDVEAKERRWLNTIRVTVVTAGEPLEVETSTRGIGAGRRFADELRRRIGA